MRTILLLPILICAFLFTQSKDSNIHINGKSNPVMLVANVGECDMITFRNGDEVEAKVLEITETEVKYKRCDNLDGPTMTVYKSKVLMVKYPNGVKDVFKEEEISEPEDSYVSQPPVRMEQSELDKISEKLRKENYQLELLLLLNNDITYIRHDNAESGDNVSKQKQELIDGYHLYKPKYMTKYRLNYSSHSAEKKLVAIIEPQYSEPGSFFRFYYRVSYGFVNYSYTGVVSVDSPDFDFLFGYTLFSSDNDYTHAAAHLVARVMMIYRDLTTERYYKVGFFETERNNLFTTRPKPIGTEYVD